MNRWRLISLAILLVAVIAVGGCFLFPNSRPVASFTVSRGVDPNDANDHMFVVLNAIGSSDPDGDDIVSYMWALEEDGVMVIAPQGTTMTLNTPILTVKYAVETTDPTKVELVVVDSNGAPSYPVSQDIQVPVPVPE